MRRAARVAGLATALLLGGTTCAWAQSDMTRLKETARALYQKGDYQGSLETLERAQKVAPDPHLFWNMAACEKKLGRYAKAMGHVALYQSAVTDLSEAQANEARQFLVAVKAYVGTITVASKVEAVRVFVDDELVGSTPFAAPIIVDDGEHAVRFARDGYKVVERSERVRGGTEARWTVELEPNASVAPEPPHAPAQPRSPSRVGPLVVGGAGIALAAVGGAVAVVTLNDASRLQAECATSCAPSRWEKYRTTQTIGDVMIAVGATAVAAGAVWWILQPTGRAQDRRAWVAPTLGGVLFGETF